MSKPSHKFPGAMALIKALEQGENPRVAQLISQTTQALAFGPIKYFRLLEPQTPPVRRAMRLLAQYH